MHSVSLWSKALPLFSSCRPAFKTNTSFYWSAVVVMVFSMDGDGTSDDQIKMKFSDRVKCWWGIDPLNAPSVGKRWSW